MNEALWALSGVFVGAISSGIVSLILQHRQFSHDKDMHTLQNLGKENVKSLLVEMLSHKSYTDRSFEALHKKVGGFHESEIRQFLHEVGAKKTSRDNNTEEWWYLGSREVERTAKREQRT